MPVTQTCIKIYVPRPPKHGIIGAVNDDGGQMTKKEDHERTNFDYLFAKGTPVNLRYLGHYLGHSAQSSGTTPVGLEPTTVIVSIAMRLPLN